MFYEEGKSNNTFKIIQNSRGRRENHGIKEKNRKKYTPQVGMQAMINKWNEPNNYIYERLCIRFHFFLNIFIFTNSILNNINKHIGFILLIFNVLFVRTESIVIEQRSHNILTDKF